LQAVEILNKDQQTRLLSGDSDVDGQLYDNFFSKPDQTTMRAVRVAEASDLNGFADDLQDPRLKALLPLYKARNYPKSLSAEELLVWEKHRQTVLSSGGNQSRLVRYFARLEELSKNKLSPQKQYLLEELHLYGESIMPVPDFAD
jgi:exodeoxyribonuclease-1